MTDRGGARAAQAGIVALATVVPAGLGVTLRHEAAAHPAAAVALVLAYEALLGVVAFAGRVFSLLESRWADRAADWIDRAVRGRLSRFERRYRAYVEETHRFSDVKGLTIRGDQTPRLEEVFVDVSLRPSPLHEADRGPLTGADSADPVPARRSLRELLATPEPAVLAVVGKPGTGKTTLLEHTAVRLVREGADAGTGRDLPVLLFLRDHVAAVVQDPGRSLPERLRSALPGDLVAEEPPGWLEEQLDRGRCVVMLDGLDEVARPRDRHAMVAWVDRQISRWPRNHWVLTSRPAGYLSSPLNRAQVLQVRRFTGEQIARFLRRWYGAVERISTGLDDEGVRRRALAGADDLLRRLRNRPMLYDLAANPLLLTMIANVHRYRGALPGSRAELYAEICQVLLWRRREARLSAEDREEISGVKKEVVLQELAFSMMTEKTRDLPVRRAEELLGPALERVGAAVTGAEFLDSVVASGLLVEREAGLCAFAHQTFQEHLASVYVREHDRVADLVAAVKDDWWRETILLWAARTDPGEVVEACLDDGGVPALALAFDCWDEAATIAPDTRRRLREYRARALREPRGTEARRLITAVTFARHLREIVRLTDDTLLCARPVTRELYELFAEEHPQFAPPPGPGDPAAPAVGMTAHAAHAFVQWVNDLTADIALYRLPRPGHLADPAARTVLGEAPQTVWVADAPQPRLWVPEGVPHPWSTTGDRIRERLLEDGPGTLRTGLAQLLAHAHAHVLVRAHRHVRELAGALTRDSGPDLAHALDLTGGRALTLALARARTGGPQRPPALVRGLEQSLGLAHALARDLALALDRSRDLVRGLDEVLPLVRRFDGGGPAGAREIARLLGRTVDRALARDFTRDSVLHFVLAHAVVLSHELVLALDPACVVRPAAPAPGAPGADGSGPGSPLDPGTAFDRSRELADELNRALALAAAEEGEAGQAGTGQAAAVHRGALLDFAASCGMNDWRVRDLAYAPGALVPLVLALADRIGPADGPRGGRRQRPLPHPLSLCAAHAGAPEAPHTSSPEALTARSAALRDAVGVTALLPDGAGVLVERMAPFTAALHERGTAGHPEAAAAVRLAALTLAAAGDTRHTGPARGFADDARSLAAAVTVLQDRTDGTRPPTETLYLTRA